MTMKDSDNRGKASSIRVNMVVDLDYDELSQLDDTLCKDTTYQKRNMRNVDTVATVNEDEAEMIRILRKALQRVGRWIDFVLGKVADAASERLRAGDTGEWALLVEVKEEEREGGEFAERFGKFWS